MKRTKINQETGIGPFFIKIERFVESKKLLLALGAKMKLINLLAYKMASGNNFIETFFYNN